MEGARKILKKYYCRQIVACFLAWCMLFLGMPMRVALANPNPGADAHPSTGSYTATLGGTAGTLGNTTTVNAPNGSIFDWQNFDIGSSHTVNIVHGPMDAVLNRVNVVDGYGDAAATGINGALNAAGSVFIVNPQGVVFGPAAYVRALNLVASSLNISDSDWTSIPSTGVMRFAGGGIGDVETLAGSTIEAEGIALIGRNVINRGALVAPDGYVLMAAGESVLITTASDLSNVVVKVAPMANPTEHVVDNGGSKGTGPGTINAEGGHVILAAGDIFSTAIEGVETLRAEAQGDAVFTGDIHAEAGPGSDAVADVTIITGGDLTVDDDITAEATGNGVDNAIAAVTINAGGNVEVKSDGSHSTTIKAKAGDGANNYADVKIDAGGNVTVSAKDDDVTIKAEASGGVLSQANIEITGQNVAVESEDSGGWFDWFSPDDALIYAYAHDGGQNMANVAITANGQEDQGYVMVQSIGEGGDDVLIKAEAKNGQENTAGIDITATRDVEIGACGLFDEVLVQAEAWNKIELKPEILTPEVVVEIIDDKEVEVEQEVVVDLAVESRTNTATVDITAGGRVDVVGEGSGDAGVKAVARNEIEVDIDNYDNEVTVNLTVENLENNASVTITAVDDVEVGAYGASSKVGVSAEAYNELEIKQDTGGKYWVQDGYWWWQGHWEYYESYAAALNLEVAGLENNANIDITATDGSVKVIAEECWLDSEAKIEALALNTFEVDIYEESIGTLTFDNLVNNANIDIAAAGDVDVMAENGSESGILANAWNELYEDEDASGAIIQDNMVNNAGVTIDAGGSVMVKADCEGDCSEAYILAWAYNDTPSPQPENKPESIVNTANVDITAGDGVKVIGKDCGEARIEAATLHGTENTSGVTINSGGDVLVLGVNGDASIEAVAEEGGDNTATVGINAVGGDVKVIDIGEGGERTAKIEARAEGADNSNTADVTINATAEEVIVEDEIVCIEGGDVKVIAKDGGKAQITAFASETGEGEEDDSEGVETSNTANVTIKATSKEMPVKDGIIEVASVMEDEVVGGDVKVIAEGGSEAEIEAIAMKGYTNTADVLICIDGGVKVEGDRGGDAEIEALAKDGYSNTASVGIGAKGERGVEVIADRGGEAGISSKAKDGYINTASTIVCTQGGVDVIALRGGDAEILAQAKDGFITDAYVGIGAWGDVVVRAGQEYMLGCEAGIRAEAEYGGEGPHDESTSSATAKAVVFTHEGCVDVLAYNGGLAEIIAEAQGAHTNTADVGIAAGADLSPAQVAVPDYPNGDMYLLSVDNFDMLPLSGNVLVEAYGKGSEAQVLAWAHDASPIYVEVPGDDGQQIPGENTAKTVICAPGEVRVATYEGGQARIKSRAGWYGDGDAINKATTKVYATDVKVYTSAFRGQGIWAWAYSDNSDNPHVPGEMMLDYLGEPYNGSYYCMGEHGEIAWTDGDAVLYIQDYSKRTDCPTCPPCPCEEGGALFAPAAPLAQFEIPRIEGCPALMNWLAMEIGVPSEQVQIYVAKALASSPDIQPCQMCARLKDAAVTLADADGTLLAALSQVVNEFVTPPVPPSEEQMAVIAAALTNPAEGTNYALAAQWVDALVAYVSIMTTEMGYSVADSAVVADKYLAPVSAMGNASLTAYVQARLSAIGG